MKKKVNIIWVIALSVLVIAQFVLIVNLAACKDETNSAVTLDDAVIVPEETKEAEQDIQNIEEETIEEQTTLEINYNRGVFSWEPSMAEPANRTEMYEIIELLDINEVYQYFDPDVTDANDAYDLASELSEMGVGLYMLAGESDWTYKADGANMLDVISRAAEYRQNWGEDKLAGIVFDIEPYDSRKWSQGKQDILLQNYLDGMEVAYNAAKDEGLRIILCIPSWYDNDYNDLLAELFNYCDEAAVMNYDRTNEYENMINEINYAKELSKDIMCIFEFQEVGQYNLTDNQTYNNAGVEAAIESFESVYAQAGYEKLNFAFHYLRPLQKMLIED